MGRQIAASGMIVLGTLGLLLALLYLLPKAYQKKKSEMYMPVVSMIGASMVMVYSGFRLLMV